MCNCGSFDLDCALPPEAEPQQLSQDEIANYRDVPLWWTDHNDEPTWGTQVEEAKQARQENIDELWETVIELGGTTGNVPLDDAICQFESDDTRSDLLSCWPEYAKKDTERRFNDLIPRANLYSVDEVPTPAENKAKQKGKDILRPSCFMFRDDAEVKKYYTAENIPKFISLYRSCLGGAEEPRDAEDNARAQEDNDKFDLMIPNFGDVSDDRKVYLEADAS